MHFKSVESEHYRVLEKAYITWYVAVRAVHGLDEQIADVSAGECKLFEEM